MSIDSIQDLESKYKELGEEIQRLKSKPTGVWEPENGKDYWSDSLSLADNQTWVLCFVSDDSPKERRYAEWISEVLDDGYRGPEGLAWTHATPVDLNLRFWEGEE